MAEAGVGLLDVLVAITVLMVVMIPAAYLIDSTVQQTASAREQVTATELDEQELETLNNASLTQLEASLDVSQVASSPRVGGTKYTVSTYLTWQGVGSQPDLCQSGSPPQSISATVSTSWGKGAAQKIAEQSVIDPPYTQPTFTLASALKSGTTYTSIVANAIQTLATGSVLTVGAGTSQDQTVTVSSPPTTTTISVSSFKANSTYSTGTPVALPDEGFIGVQIDGVSGSAPAGVTGIPVQITNIPSSGSGTTTTYYPDSNGCVYEEALPGTYYVTLGSNTSPPFVDKYENPAPTTLNSPVYADQVVSAGSATIWQATFNQGGTVNFSAPGSVPVAGGVPVSVGNSGIPGTNWTTVIPTTSSATSATLYPFTSNYTVWYGDCLAEEPAAASTMAVTGGGTGSVTVTGLIDLTVQPDTTSGTAGAAASTTVQVADPVAGDGCPGDTFTLPTSTATVPSEAAVVDGSRSDTTGVSTQLGSDVITDPSILASDQGKEVTGPGIPTKFICGHGNG